MTHSASPPWSLTSQSRPTDLVFWTMPKQRELSGLRGRQRSMCRSALSISRPSTLITRIQACGTRRSQITRPSLLLWQPTSSRRWTPRSTRARRSPASPTPLQLKAGPGSSASGYLRMSAHNARPQQEELCMVPSPWTQNGRVAQQPVHVSAPRPRSMKSR